MRIDGKYLSVWLGPGPEKVGRRAPEAAKALPGEDAVEMSDRAQAMGVARAALGEASLARSQQVERLKHLVQSGQYNPSSLDIAKAMLEG